MRDCATADAREHAIVVKFHPKQLLFYFLLQFRKHELQKSPSLHILHPWTQHHSSCCYNKQQDSHVKMRKQRGNISFRWYYPAKLIITTGLNGQECTIRHYLTITTWRLLWSLPMKPILGGHSKKIEKFSEKTEISCHQFNNSNHNSHWICYFS